MGFTVLLWSQVKMWVQSSFNRDLKIESWRWWYEPFWTLKKKETICFSVRSRLKETFIYPVDMNIKTPEFEGFLHEVWANHWESKKKKKAQRGNIQPRKEWYLFLTQDSSCSAARGLCHIFVSSYTKCLSTDGLQASRFSQLILPLQSHVVIMTTVCSLALSCRNM